MKLMFALIGLFVCMGLIYPTITLRVYLRMAVIVLLVALLFLFTFDF